MYPVLFRFPEAIPLIGGAAIYTYGVLIAVAFMVGITWTLREARRAGMDREKVLDLTYYVIIAAIVGSRLLYVVIEYERYVSQPLNIFKIWEGGLVFYGGLLACVAVSWWYTRRHQWSLRSTADLYMPGVALGHAIGRLGCLMAGCCYGKPVEGDPWWAISFPVSDVSLAPANMPLYPTQVLESLTELAIFAVLIVIRRHKRFSGQVFLTYLILYGLGRSLLEVLRGDAIRGYVIPHYLSTSQFISLVVVSIAVLYYWRKLRSLREKRAGFDEAS